MKPSSVRSRVVTGCLLTMLLPASSSLLANGASTATFDLCPVERTRLGTMTFGVPRELFPASARTSINAMAPWFRETTVPLRVDRVCLVTASVEAPAGAEFAVAEVKPPGVVHNLRRTDLR